MGAFRSPDLGKLEYVLSNLYVWFWRWATWKVFEAPSNKDGTDTGIACFITSAAWLTGPGFAGMREYMRRKTDFGFIINVSPEGHQPPVPTRFFPGVQQPLAIAIFVRTSACSEEQPSDVRYVEMSGSRAAKLNALSKLSLSGDEWAPCRTGWKDRLTPAETQWEDLPRLGDLMPWQAPGVKPNRTWVYNPSRDVLRERWQTLVYAEDADKAALFRESRDSSLLRPSKSVPGVEAPAVLFKYEKGPCPELVRVGFRALDRQWIIPDGRLMDTPRPDLWAVRSQCQVFATEQHADPLEGGPALAFSAFIPDMHHTNGRGGRVLPLWRDPSGSEPNILPGLLLLLHNIDGFGDVTPEDLLAYIAAVTAHSGYTARFMTELADPGVRVPITRCSDLFDSAVSIGGQVVWLWTYGQRYVDKVGGRPTGAPLAPSGKRPMLIHPITASPMPAAFEFDSSAESLRVGNGEIRPVPASVWEYQVSGYRVVQRWLKRRVAHPDGKQTSELDRIVATKWSFEYTTELLDLLNVVRQLIEFEPVQGELLGGIMEAPLLTVGDLAQVGLLPRGKASSMGNGAAGSSRETVPASRKWRMVS